MVRQIFCTCVFLILFVNVYCRSGNDDKYSHPNLRLPEYNEKTGETIFFPRIVNGTAAVQGEFPGIVSLQIRANGNHFCGGSVLPSLRAVVTAAHCVHQSSANLFRVMADDLLITPQGSSTRQLRNVQRIIVHPQYSTATLANDIAILILDRAFANTTLIRPFPLQQFQLQYNAPCVVAGWGAGFEGGPAIPNLQRVDVYTINTLTCNQSYQGYIPNTHFCAGHMEGMRDSCQGDSGGPLLCNNILAGIVSFGEGCARPQFPGVYTDVRQFRSWIMENHANQITKPNLIALILAAILSIGVTFRQIIYS